MILQISNTSTERSFFPHLDFITLVTEFAACDNEQNCFPSFSYGIHEWQHGESYNDVMSIADQMMYTDKRHEKKTIK